MCPHITAASRIPHPEHTGSHLSMYHIHPASTSRILPVAVLQLSSLPLLSLFSPIRPLSESHPSVPPSSVHCRSWVVLESGVRTAVALLDREIQHPHEYRHHPQPNDLHIRMVVTHHHHRNYQKIYASSLQGWWTYKASTAETSSITTLRIFILHSSAFIDFMVSHSPSISSAQFHRQQVSIHCGGVLDYNE